MCQPKYRSGAVIQSPCSTVSLSKSLFLPPLPVWPCRRWNGLEWTEGWLLWGGYGTCWDWSSWISDELGASDIACAFWFSQEMLHYSLAYSVLNTQLIFACEFPNHHGKQGLYTKIRNILHSKLYDFINFVIQTFFKDTKNFVLLYNIAF